MAAFGGGGGLDATVTGTAASSGRSFGFAGWLALAAIALWPVVEVIRIVIQPAHEVVFGDYALFELSSRQAWHFDQLLGPSAQGFNHPGPVMFYLLAPAVRLLEPGPGLYLGAVLINAAALVAITVTIWRRGGPLMALWAATVLNLFCLSIGLDTLRQPSNTLLIIVPMVLFVVLWAGAVTGIPGSWLWAAVIGSYEVQNHVTTAIFVLVMLIVGGGWALVARWRRPSPRPGPAWSRQPARWSGLVALLLIWLPSTVELFADNPNNFQKTWRFVHHGHSPGIGISAASGIALRSIAISPFNHRIWTAPLPGSRVEVVAAWLTMGAAGLLIYWLMGRRQWFALALVSASILAIPLATLTVTHAGADNFAFLTGWLGFVPCVLLLALGMGLLDARPSIAAPLRAAPRRRKPATATAMAPQRVAPQRVAPQSVAVVVAVVAVVFSGLAVGSDLREKSVASESRAAARATSFVGDAEAMIRPGDRWIGFLIVSPSDWQVAAGVILEVERLGYHTVVDTRYDYLFGKQRTDLHPVQVLFTFYLANQLEPGQITPGVPVSTAGGTVMNSFRPAG